MTGQTIRKRTAQVDSEERERLGDRPDGTDALDGTARAPAEAGEAVFDCFGVTDDQRETVPQETALRTIEDRRERTEYNPESITKSPERHLNMSELGVR